MIFFPLSTSRRSAYFDGQQLHEQTQHLGAAFFFLLSTFFSDFFSSEGFFVAILAKKYAVKISQQIHLSAFRF
jgi:hypothetical protein